MTNNPGNNKPAWVQLYEARRLDMEVEPRTPGRPPAPIPRRKVGFTLSQGEIRELDAWQDRFSRLLNRKVSIGETIGILVRICTARYLRLTEQPEPGAEPVEPPALVDLVGRMIGE
jgi:hypothetical protein